MGRGKRLYLGTEQGTVYRFMDESEENAYYDDVAVDGSLDSARAIEAVWEIPRPCWARTRTTRRCATATSLVCHMGAAA